MLDFGLAKAMDDGGTGTAEDRSISPTLSLAATKAGIILGTAAYMSPEQARGKPVDRRSDADIYRGRVASAIPPEPVLVRPGAQWVTDVAADVEHAVFSPDGAWIAYESEETGKDELWVQEFPGPGTRIKVSSGEWAEKPVWKEAGLFYLNFGNWLFREDLDPGPGFEPAVPQILIPNIVPRSFGRPNYAVSPDGTRLLVPRAVGDTDSTVREQTLRVVLNWLDEVKRRAPAER